MREFNAYKQEKKKLDLRCEKSIFVGYDKNSPAYLVYNPDTGRVRKHRQVKFVTKSVVERHTQTDFEASDDDFYEKRFVSTKPETQGTDSCPKETQEARTETDDTNTQTREQKVKIDVIPKEKGRDLSI